ncbi:DUF2905 domain-containing protein [Caldisericum exile]|uniref:DUF2905 domain-containing protein n=1 Tax=Caldisericum exile (strain DSM 21853 / NBRC 104410 / AZM16c01) TaxID=511051 RepID=A0A7U6GFZ6_CALEA|nr:DUF2905 domain-containing protein [Caldisericum exile]BAL81674.1 hypothetical protein CSE_15480 [Caldisericum exile AZM16c01]
MKMWKVLVLLGALLIVFGFIVMLFENWKFRLPGDIYIKRDNFEFYFPITTSIVISLILTLILNLIFRK